MDLEALKKRLLAKPSVLVIPQIIYFLALIFLKWKLSLPLDALWFFVGGVLGIYLLDIAEEFFKLNPSPFRTILFSVGLAAVGFYVITSTNEMIAKGLILGLNFTILLFQLSEWKVKHNLNSWYGVFFGNVELYLQQVILVAFILVFVGLTILFL